ENRQIVQMREVLRPGLRGHLPRLFHTRYGGGQIIIVGQGRLDEFLQGFIFENLPPRQVGQGVLLLRAGPTKVCRRGYVWSSVVGTGQATCQKQAQEKNDYRKALHGRLPLFKS